GGSTRYFDDPTAAAFAAVKYSIDMVKAWEQSKLVSDIGDLEVMKKQLLLDIEHLNKTKSQLQTYVGSLNGAKSAAMSAVKAVTSTLERARSTAALEAEEKRKLKEQKEQLPAFMHRALTHVFRQGKPH